MGTPIEHLHKDQEQGQVPTPHVFNVILEISATSNRQEKAIRGIHIEMEGELSLSTVDGIIWLGDLWNQWRN